MSRSSTSRTFGRETALWVGGIVGSLCLASLVAGWLFNVTPLVFASGSMSPAYEAGALGIAREVPAADLRVGDVVSVATDDGRVTHRIVEIAPQGDRAVLTLQGDTNNIPDAESYAVTAADRVDLGVPYAGYPVNAAASPVGLLAGGILVVGLLLLGFRPQGPRPADASRQRRLAFVGTGAVSAVALGGAIGLTGLTPFATTSALWSDSATATAGFSAIAPDNTAPLLTNPLPANGASGSTWSAISCASSPNQVCVNATDTGGSGVSAVFVNLVRTSGTTQCWNGSAFVNGTGCAPQAMSLVSGSQYRSNGLLASQMTGGSYQATYTASDVAGNTATPLVASFTVLPAPPTITTCVNTASGSAPYRLNWSWPGPGNPDSFLVVYSVNPGGTRNTVFAGTARTGLTVPINNESGTLRLVAIIGGVQSAVSNQASYSGSGGGKSCSVP